MVLLSDGEDNQSRVYPDEAIKMCQRAETIIYAISTNWTPSRGKGDQVLAQMAQETGGQVFFPPSVEEVSNSFHDIEEELRSQYALTYTPADFKYDGAFRHHLSLLQRPALPGAGAQGILCAAAVDGIAREMPGRASFYRRAFLWHEQARPVLPGLSTVFSLFHHFFKLKLAHVPFQDIPHLTVHNRLTCRFFLFLSHRFPSLHDEMKRDTVSGFF